MAIIQRDDNELVEVLEYLDVKMYNGISDITIILFGATIFALIGIFISMLFPDCPLFIGAIDGLIFWFGIYFLWGYTNVNSQDVLIVERFGKFKAMYEAGWHILCFPGLLDKKAQEPINLKKATSYIRTESDDDVEIDFNCGSSAPIKGEVWYEIIDPIFWYYRVTNPQNWLRSQTSAFMQPILERRTLDEARDEKTTINTLFLKATDTKRTANNGVININLRNSDFKPDSNQSIVPYQEFEELCFHDFVKAQIGVEITALLLIDIKIPTIIQEIRNTELAAKLKKKTRKIDSSGYIESIKTIKEQATEMGENLSFTEAQQIYNLNKDREAFKDTGANISLVGSDVQSMIASFLNGRN